MPIRCPVAFPRLTEAELRDLDYEVMRHAFTTHRTLGRLCDESVFQNHLAHLLVSAGLAAQCEVPVILSFRSFTKPLYLDLVVAGRALYELKTVAALAAAHVAQLLNYLFLTNSSRGKLVNFRPASVESQFVNAPLDHVARRSFQLDAGEWHGPAEFQNTIAELVTDWGTGLDQALYTQALVHCLGGEETVTRALPMRLDGSSLGHQRFHLLEADTAFHLTTFPDEPSAWHRPALQRLIAPSPLRHLHWINIAHHQITLRTLAR